MKGKVAMARGHQLLLQREGSDPIALAPEMLGVLLAAEGLLFRCALPQPAQGGELLTGADAGLVVVGSEGALQPLRQLLFPPIGTYRNRQHQSQGSNPPEPKQQLTRCRHEGWS